MKKRIKDTLKERLEAVQAGKSRQHFHLMADIGWISDPNGFAVHDGTVHIFHQYTPAADRGLSKSWGHYTTKDWKHFIDEGTLMVPDCRLDKDGCYSGSGYSKDGTLHLFYTGNILEDGVFDYIYEGRGHYVNHLASKDGRTFGPKECLLVNEDYPANMSCHVRDPKVADTRGLTAMVLGARTRDDRGCALLYKADPKAKGGFSLLQVIDSKKPFGYMWECPDLFELDGQLFLLCCPQGVKTEGHNYENVYQNGVFSLSGSLEDGRLVAGEFQELDHGFDFYAPQTMLDDQGRRILIGWMGMPDADYTNPETAEGWQHCLTLPRELTNHDGQVWSYPIREVLDLAYDQQAIHLASGREIRLDQPQFMLDLNIDQQPFTLKIRNDLSIVWDGKVLTFAPGSSGAGRKERHIDTKSISSLQIFSDTSSVELFVNYGQYALSSRIYDAGKEHGIQSDIPLDGTLARMDSIEIDYQPALD